MPEYFKKKKTPGEPLRKEGQFKDGPNPYSHRRYRNFRKRIKSKQRAIDEQKVQELYQQDESIPFKQYNAFIQSDNPLCVECLEEGNIIPGRVLDHIKAIEKGGSKYDQENLQWMCDRHHNIKRATEDKK